jgi:superfamily II DNA or RNA helicase
MTATPYETDLLALRNMLYALGLHTGTEDHWILTFHYWKQKPNGSIVPRGLRPEAPAILRDWLNPYYLRREGPLPGIRLPQRIGDHFRFLSPTAAQRVELQRADSIWKYSSIKGFHAAKKATAGVNGVSPKATAIVDEILSRPKSEKIIVYSEWTETLDLLGEMFAIEGVDAIRIDGSTAHAKRVDAVDAIRSDPNIQVLLGTDVLARGLDLQFARVLLSHDGHDTAARADQLRGRICRPGSEHDTYEMITFLLDHQLDLRRQGRQTRRDQEAAELLPDNSGYHCARTE